MGEQAPFYLYTAFVFAYGTGTLHLTRGFLLASVLTATTISFVAIPLFGHLSDRFGRKRVYMLGAAVTGVYGFVYFALLDTRSPALVFAAIALSLLPHDMMYGPQAALIAESFVARVRYTGASLGYQLSSLIAGGPAPIIATWLFSRYHSGTVIAVFIMACAIVSLIATSMLKEYAGQDVAAD
jgi:MFS family permease